MLESPTQLSAPDHPIARLPEEWALRLAEWGEPRYRGLQVFRWIHARGQSRPEEWSDLPIRLRTRLAEELGAAPPAVSLAQVDDAGDTTQKLLVALADGLKVETVLIPQGGPDAPVTQCVSSQVGCAMGCVFCASGLAGLKRNLGAAEIVGQVLEGRRLLGDGRRLRNVVFMGMGEPLHNYDAVARALVLMCHSEGLGLSKRRVTVSTSGLVPQIDRLGSDFAGEVQLAISLHAVHDERRSDIMPINRKHGLAELVAALRRYPLPRRRRITIEYTLIAGVNDDPRDADEMVRLLSGIPIKVNLIPMNPVVETPLSAPADASVLAFQEQLRKRGVPTFLRRRRGDDIAAACGQLALRGESRRIRRRLDVLGIADPAAVGTVEGATSRK